MAFYPNSSMPPPASTGTPRTQESARAPRMSQAQYIEERLRNGIPPVAVAGVAALLTQLDTMQALPGMSLVITAEVAGYRRTVTCRNNAWDGYDLTHQVKDERSTSMYGPSRGNVFEQEASLKMMPINQPVPQPQMVSYQQVMPMQTQVAQSQASSPAFGMPPTTAQTTARVQTMPRVSGSDPESSEARLLPLPSPDLTGRSPSEQAVIVALQVVANYPESSDFVRAAQQRVPGLAEYLQAAAQPSGCEPTTVQTEAPSMDTDARQNSARALPESSSEEAGRKRLTQETTAPDSTSSVTGSPTSRPPPDKQRDEVSKPNMKSVVIVRPPFGVGHAGRGAPQMTLQDAIERYGDPEISSDSCPVPTGTKITTTESTPSDK